MRDQYVKLIVYLQNENNYVNGNKLAMELNVSSRTVRNYIKDLNENYLVDSRIITHQSKGYRLKGEIKELKRSQHLEFEERAFFIIKHFLGEDDWVTYDQIAQRLFFSSQTIRSDILKIQGMIESQNRDLELESIIFQGLLLKGSEIDKRLFLDSLTKPPMLNRDNLRETLLYYFKDWIDEVSLGKVLMVLEKELSASRLPLTPEGLLPIISYLIISMKRMEQGNYIEEKDVLDELIDSSEYKLAERVLKKVSSLFQIRITEGEVHFFSFYLMSTRILSGADNNEISEKVPAELNEAVTEVLANLDEQYGYHFSGDKQLYSGLLLHIVRDLYPLLYNFYIENSFITHIKMEYIQAYYMAVSFAHQLKNKANLNLPENEIGYIALHFASFLERKSKKQIKIAIVQGKSPATANLIKTNIERRFSEIEIIGIFDFRDFAKIPKDIQMIVTQRELINKTTIPIVNVSSFLTNEDYEKINQISHQKMLTNLIQEENFFLTNEMDKEKLLLKMAKKMGMEELYPSILDREKLSTTDIDDFVALPHPLEYQNNNQFKLGIAINKQAIEWGKQEVKLVFLLFPSSHEQERYAYIFKELHEILKNKDKINKLLQVTSASQFVACINE